MQRSWGRSTPGGLKKSGKACEAGVTEGKRKT